MRQQWSVGHKAKNPAPNSARETHLPEDGNEERKSRSWNMNWKCYWLNAPKDDC